jgi:hypothetical protein
VLGISPDAAKQRLHRAIEKLREICSSSGITAPSATVGAALAESAIIKAPAGMAQAASAAALGGGSSATIILAKGATLAMTMKKAQAAAVVLFGVLLLVSAVLLTMFELSRQRPLQASSVEPVATQPAAPPDAPKLLEPTTEKWGMPSENPDPPIEADDPPDAIIAPAVDATTIRTRDPDHTYHGIAARTWDQFGLIQFDISEIKTPPQKAVLRAGVVLVENTRNLRTPARLKFYRLTTKWDPSATARFADSHRKVPWNAGEIFRGDSHADLDQKQIGEVEIPNPPPKGFAVVVDVTELVQKWVSGEWPNHGIMVRCDQIAGYSYQVNLTSHVDKKYPIEIMVEAQKK